MLRKSLAILTILAMIFIVACSSGNSSNSGNSKGNNDKSNDGGSSGTKTKITLLHWKQENINKVIEEINRQFEAEYPEYEVEYITTEPNDAYKEAMRTRLTAGTVDIFPDLAGMRLRAEEWAPGAEVPYWQEYIDSGWIADLTDQPFVKNYEPKDIELGGTYNGKVYGIPAGKVAMSGLFYNKDMFEKYGLKVPTTWSEFVEVCEALLAEGITPIAMAGKDVWPLKLPVFGLQAAIYADGDQEAFIRGLWEGTRKYNDPDAVEVLEKMKLIQDKYTIDGFMGIDYGTLPSYFINEQVAMMPNGTWEITTIQSANPSFEFGYFPIPATEQPQKNLVGKIDMTWYVAENGPNKEGAIKWLEFFSRADIYQQFIDGSGFIPTQPGIQVIDFYKEIEQYLGDNFQLAYELLMINRPGVGELLEAEGVHTEFLAPGGPFKTAKELADAQQAAWEAAAPK